MCQVILKKGGNIEDQSERLKLIIKLLGRLPASDDGQ